ncbi:hypothetical protein ACNJYD_08475 [Bradyrhizobium sp. DASA03005]|uniref:hypothetical protein n=1 Tax=Bradyrhizobium sp. SPXBL-02 TaxID=3395912 RepID=UPI003F7281F3
MAKEIAARRINSISTPVWAALFFTSFGFLLIGFVGYLMAPPRLSVAEIAASAQHDVPEVQCPPRPAGRVEQSTVARQVCTDVPKISGFRIETNRICTNIQEPTVRFVDPPTDEISRWETDCKQRKDARSDRLQARIAEISARQRSELKDYVNDMIKIALGIVGVMAAFLGLWAGGKMAKGG